MIKDIVIDAGQIGSLMNDYPNNECPICLDPLDYCPGHGEIGDPEGFRMLKEYHYKD
jgi:hypothetical protein